MSEDRKHIVIFLMSLVVGAILVACFFVPVKPSKDWELRELQIQKTKLSIEVLKAQLNEKNLTTDDLKAIYACVDQKIKNQKSEIKFPCVAVRGDSF